VVVEMAKMNANGPHKPVETFRGHFNILFLFHKPINLLQYTDYGAVSSLMPFCCRFPLSYMHSRPNDHVACTWDSDYCLYIVLLVSQIYTL